MVWCTMMPDEIESTLAGFGSVVVVVDDEPIVLRLTIRMLNLPEYSVVACSNAREALARLEKGDVCAVVTDVSMPEMSGFALLAEVRKRIPGLPVVLMTGQSALCNAQLALEHGAFAFLEKPFDAESLRLIVDGALEAHRALLQRQDN